jgi:protein-tyrosine phosphatase
MKTPIHTDPCTRTYWVESGKLLAGCYPGDKDPRETTRKLTALLDAGIRVVINLMEKGETDLQGHSFLPYEPELESLAQARDIKIDIVRIPIRDMGIPNEKVMKRILTRIDTALAKNKTVFLHCWGGRGRTGTVIGCFLARHGIAEGDLALERIRILRAGDPSSRLPSPETSEQRDMVRGWREGE